MLALAILVAAGRGERLGGGCPKAFRILGGQPLLLWAALAFEAAPSVGAIVAVVPAGEVEPAEHLLRPVGKLRAVVEGGTRRQDSVLQGLKQAPDGFEGVVLVHDAARPLVGVPLIEAVAQAAAEGGAAVPLLSMVDTVKRVRGGQVVETLDRSELGVAQTPQGFRFALLTRAYEQAFLHRVTLTDEAMAVERLGVPVATVEGSALNRKITTPEDLVWAEGVIAHSGARP
jgi:2-C-methyl-D-erythritol 4-phosphate cytidylyltransferase